MVAVPYNGAPPAILDLMANRVQFAIQPLGLLVPHINSGALKALAVVSHHPRSHFCRTCRR